MECLKAQQLISEAIDAAVPEDELAEARAHCVGCEECTRFVRLFERVGSLPTPSASADLIARLIALGAEEAVVIRATPAEVIEESPAPAEEITPTSPTHFLPSWWAPRLTTFAAVAAVLLVALVATGIGLGGMLSPKQATDGVAEDTRMQTDGGAARAGAPATGDAQSTTETYSGKSFAPPLVVIDGLVYAPTGPRTVDAATLVTATPVLTSLDAASDPVSLPAYKIGNTNDTAVLLLGDGTYLGFSVVTRSFGGRTFALASGSMLTAYGQWPMLPARFQQPTAPDGSPTFSFFGKDDLGVQIYVPTGGQPTEGFAVAPGTSPDDPAAGSPNWTWWQPL